MTKNASKLVFIFWFHHVIEFLGGEIATYHSWPPFQWLYNNTFSKSSSSLLPILDWKVDHYSKEMCANSLFQEGDIFPKETVVIVMVMMVFLRSLSFSIVYTKYHRSPGFQTRFFHSSASEDLPVTSGFLLIGSFFIIHHSTERSILGLNYGAICALALQ